MSGPQKPVETSEQQLESRREFFRKLLVLRYAAPFIATYPMKALAQSGPTGPPDRCCDGSPPPCSPPNSPPNC